MENFSIGRMDEMLKVELDVRQAIDSLERLGKDFGLDFSQAIQDIENGHSAYINKQVDHQKRETSDFLADMASDEHYDMMAEREEVAA